MLVSEISQTSIPVLQYDDTIEEATELFRENNLEHLPVVSGEKCEGLLSFDELIAAGKSDVVGALKNKLIHVGIPGDQHFLAALKVIATANVSLLPVLSQNGEYIGTVSQQDLLHALYTLLNCDVPGGIFVIEMPKQNFSMGELCRLVETNDAIVTQLNTYTEHLSGLLIVTFKINKTEVSDILATLQRYEYNVRYYFGEEYYENELRENFDNLMSYLNI